MTDQDNTPDQIRPGTGDGASQTPQSDALTGQSGQRPQGQDGQDFAGEKSGEDIGEAVTQDGADEISQSATGGLGNTEGVNTRP